MHAAMWIENPGTYARASSSRRSESRGVSAWDLRDQRAAKAISQAGDAKVTSHDALRVHSFRLRTHRVLGRSLGGYNFYWSAPKQVFAVFAPSHSPIPHCSLRAFRLSSARFYVRTYVRTHLPIPPSVPVRVPYARSRWMIRGLLRAGALARRHHEVVLSAQTTVSDSFAGAGPIKMGRFTQSR